MKKLVSINTGLLLLSTSIFAEEHTAAALEHAQAASKVTKSVPKNHLDAAIKALKESNDLGNFGHVG